MLDQAHMTSLFENATEGIYQSSPEGKFITLNPSLAKMFGFDYTYVSNERELTDCLVSFYANSDKPKLLEIDTSIEENAEILQAYFKVMY